MVRCGFSENSRMPRNKDEITQKWLSQKWVRQRKSQSKGSTFEPMVSEMPPNLDEKMEKRMGLLQISSILN